jgi:hypothetical protein
VAKCPMITRCIADLIAFFFGCRHSRYSFPVTIRGVARPHAAPLTGPYVACLDCGREFPYDWQQMRIILSKRERRQYVAPLAAKRAGVVEDSP